MALNHHLLQQKPDDPDRAQDADWCWPTGDGELGGGHGRYGDHHASSVDHFHLAAGAVHAGIRPGGGEVKVIAHRGGGAEALENSAAALRRAISLGVDGVEVDIWPTRDEGFVVLHDADIARLTGRPGWTSYLTLAEIQALRIGGPIRRKLLGERALSLRQALQVVAGR
ncbi:TPA: hypothetical protein DCL37_06950, partial [Candidatus Acetothermia bacterium]|nr:hypothetical protein [Candidatus Acetothermia bacterium]